MKALLATLLILVLPAAAAQTPGQAQAYVGLPHVVDLRPGPNGVGLRIAALLSCEEGKDAPAPLHVAVLYGALGPDDGKGPAWVFGATSWNLTWTRDGRNYTIDETLNVQVEGHGHGATGRAGEFSIGTTTFHNPSSTACTSTGYTVPARSGHAHIQVGPRPVEEAKDSPALALPLLAMGALAVAALRRR